VFARNVEFSNATLTTDALSEK